MPHSLKLRLTLLAAVWIALALVAGGLVLSIAFRQTVETAFDKRLQDNLLSVLSGIDTEAGGRLRFATASADQRFTQVYSGWYWQVSDDQGVRLRSRSLWDQQLDGATLPADTIGGVYGYLTGPREQKLRVFARRITIPHHDGALTFLVAADVSQTEKEVRSFNTLLIVSLGVLGVGLIVAIVLQVTFGLRPLRRLRGDLDKVRAGQESRLGGGYPREIDPLVDAMNGVLANNEDMIRRARAHAGDLAHGLKTPLSILRGEAAGLERSKSDQINQQIATMSRLIDRHLARAAAAGTGKFAGKRASVAAVAHDIRAGLLRLFAERQIEILIAIPNDLCFQGEREDLEEMLGNLMENACKWARNKILVKAETDRSSLRITVADDGPGLDESELDLAAERGRRFDAQTSGSGLGLAIVNDIATLCGGRLVLQRAETGGLEAILELPAAI